jgi:hypothetical protein
MMTLIDVTGRVFVHGNRAYFKNGREFNVVTERNGRKVKYLQLNGRNGGDRG